MSFYIRNSLTFMSQNLKTICHELYSHKFSIIYMFYDITKFILCHFISEI